MDNYREYGQGSADAIREEYLRKEREKREQQAEYEESMRDVFNQRKEQSQKAYNELADIFHPDHGGNSDLMKKLNEAHEIAIRQGDFSILNALHQRYARKIERRKKERELYIQRKEQTAKVYRRLSDILHPSRGGSAEKLKELNDARERAIEKGNFSGLEKLYQQHFHESLPFDTEKLKAEAESQDNDDDVAEPEDRKKSERKKQSKKTPESEPAGGKEKKPRKRRPTAAERRQKEDEEWKKEYDTFLNEFVEIERMRRNSHNSTERYQSCEAAKEKAERTRSTFEQAEAGRQKYEDQEAWLLRKFKEWRFKEEREAQRRQKNEEWHKICRQAAQAEAALNQARAEWEQLKRESADMYNRHRYRQINVHFKHFKEPTQGTWECGKYDLEAKWKVDEEEVPGRFIEALEREKHCRKAKEKMAEEYKAFIQAESIIKENEKNKSWIQKQLDKILNKSDEEEYIIKRKNIEIKKRKIDQDWQQAEYLLQELVKETDQDTINARHTRDWKEFKEKHNLHF